MGIRSLGFLLTHLMFQFPSSFESFKFLNSQCCCPFRIPSPQLSILADEFLQGRTHMCQAHQVPDTLFAAGILHKFGTIDVYGRDVISRGRFLVFPIEEIGKVGVPMQKTFLVSTRKCAKASKRSSCCSHSSRKMRASGSPQ